MNVNPKDIETFRVRLEALAASLEESLSGESDQTAPVQLDTPIGRLSRMGAIQSQQMALALRERQREQLVRVKRALGEIARGTYGECPKCGEDIAEERLEAQPAVVLCIRCAAGASGGDRPPRR